MNHTDSMGPRDHRGRNGLAVLLLLAAGAPAFAQSNSLLHAQRRPTPAATPAAGPADAPAVLAGASMAVRPSARRRDPAEDPPPNTVLLAVSPIAVEPPPVKKIQVHDLVTVIIRESRESLNDAKLKSEKDWQLNTELTRWLRLDPRDRLVPQNFERAGPPGVDFDFASQYEGKGKYDRKDSLTTRIQARVIDVKPNGNLVLEASKEITVGDEVQVATLTGECRSVDVTAQNTVLSTQVADLKIHMPDRGAVRDATRRGWLKRGLDFLRPI